MEALFTEVQGNLGAYGLILACLLPFVYLFRRQVMPVLFYGGEMVVYGAVFHVVFHGIVRFFKWFRDESTFHNVDTSGARIPQTDFHTPLTRFWDQELYMPHFLFWVEMAGFALIIYGVYKYRPINYKKNNYHGREPLGKKPDPYANSSPFTSARR